MKLHFSPAACSERVAALRAVRAAMTAEGLLGQA
jgi:hypothetical protein